MPLDPALAELIAAAEERPYVDRSKQSVEQHRGEAMQDLAELFLEVTRRGPKMRSVTDVMVDGPRGPIRLRRYEPEAPGPLPTHVYFHGGGWWAGDLETVDDACRDFAAGVPCVVLSVDYRLAPEHPYPAPLDDCFAATCWAARQARETTPETPLVSIGGSSAGGNLAAGVALRARDELGPPLAAQILEIPALDPRLDSRSMHELGDDYMLTRDGMAVSWSYYLGDTKDAPTIYAAPGLADDLSGLAPALVVTAEYDPLRDEAEHHAARLTAAGVPTEAVRYDGAIHGFGEMTAVLESARVCRERIIDFLRRHLRPTAA